MKYQIAPLFCRPWTLNGITPRLIESHYEHDYGSTLDRLNTITEELEALDPESTPGHVINRLKRDEAAALNSTLLHELYFAATAETCLRSWGTHLRGISGPCCGGARNSSRWPVRWRMVRVGHC
jgi:hypothetical protein